MILAFRRRNAVAVAILVAALLYSVYELASIYLNALGGAS